MQEELGLDISNKKIIEFNSGCDGTDCYKMYYVNIDIDLDKLTLQEEELTEVKWFSIDELYQMVKEKTLNKNQVDFFQKCMNYINEIN